MNKNALFTGQPDVHEAVAAAELSASPLAHYVLAEMPNDLEAIRAESMSYEDLRAKHDAVLDQFALEIDANTDIEKATVTQLDLAFMLGAYLPLKENAYREASPQLMALLDQQADRFGLPRRMDYDLIIDVNSAEYHRTGRMRTFTVGENALGERDFYLGHSESERFVKAAAYQLHSLIEMPETVDVNRTLEAAAANMKTFREYMGYYMRLSRVAFDTMRPYLDSYPDGTRNASGAFMPSVQLAELALHTPTEGQNTYIDESMSYFPAWSRDIVKTFQEQSMRGNNVVTRVVSGDLVLDENGKKALDGLVNEFLTFRTTHLAATRKQIPQAFDQEPPTSRRQIREFGEPDIMGEGDDRSKKGTAGFNIVNVLGGAAHRLAMTQQQLLEDKIA